MSREKQALPALLPDPEKIPPEDRLTSRNPFPYHGPMNKTPHRLMHALPALVAGNALG